MWDVVFVEMELFGPTCVQSHWVTSFAGRRREEGVK